MCCHMYTDPIYIWIFRTFTQLGNVHSTNKYIQGISETDAITQYTAYTFNYNCSISVTLSDGMYFNLQPSYWMAGQTHRHAYIYMTEELCVVSEKSICIKLWSYNRRIIGAFNHSSFACMNHHSHVLRRNYSKTKLTEDGISGWQNTLELKLVYDLIYKIARKKLILVNSVIMVCLTSRYWLYVWSVAFGLTGEHWEDPQRLV